MNRIYRTVFNFRLGVVQVAAEHARSRRKAASGCGTVLAGALLLGAGGALAAGLPTGGTVVQGSATISTPAANAMRIDQASDKLITNWQSFDIGEGYSVSFNQPSATSVALNRVLGSDGSRIMGQLNANGQVFLVNPNGVLFGRNAEVSVGGLVASTLDISDSDFLSGNYRFGRAGDSAAAVINLGRITAADGGAVALLGGQVSNEGVIVARMGTVALAAGQAITLDFGGDGLLSVQIDEATRDALVENRQLIQADGGRVVLAAAAAEALLQNVVNNTGVIRARRLENRGGEIVLDGGGSGTVSVAGTLDASSEDGSGGQVAITGEGIELKSATVDVSGLNGGGSIAVGGGYQGGGTLAHADWVRVDAGSTLKADAVGSGNGGSIVLWADGQTQALGRFYARGGASGGDGGLVETSGHALTLDGIVVNTSASAGATGTWLIDPDGFTVGSGGDITGAALTAALVDNHIEIKSTDGSGEGGDIDINDAVSWSQNTLTLTATHNINVNNVMTVSGSGGLVANYGAGVDADGVPYGLYTLQSATAGSFAGRVDISGSGEVWLGGEQYTVITDGAQLAALEGGSGNYVLGAGVTFDNAYINSFSGNLNGLGHEISHQNNAGTGGTSNGLLGELGAGGSLSNLGIYGAIIGDAGGGTVGSLVNVNHGDIVNTFNRNAQTALTNTSVIGGVVGTNYGLIADSYQLGNLAATTVGGGLAGINEATGRIVRSATRAVSGASNLSGSAATLAYVGGLVGINRGYIGKSYSEIFLSPSGSGAGAVIGGNFVGLNDETGVIDQSFALRRYSTTTTSAGTKIGGFVGENRGGISNSYFYNQYSRMTWIGGFAYINSGTISSSYAQDTSVRGTTQRYGFVAIDEGGTVIDSYYSHGYYNAVVPYVLESSSATENSLVFSSIAELATAGFDTSIWGRGSDGGPILINIPVYVSNSGVQYGSSGGAVIGSLTAAGLQRADTVASVLSQLSAAYLDAGSYAADAVLAAGGYGALLGRVTITPKVLTLSGVVADKVYDGTTAASLNDEDELSNGGLVGLVDGETLEVSYTSASFADKNAGSSKSVSVGYTLADGSGKASNYTLAGTSNGDGSGTTTTTATISKRELGADDLAALAADKTYDGGTTASASLGTSDSVALADIAAGSLGLAYGSAAFDDKNAGTDKAVTVSGLSLSGSDSANYTLSAGLSLQDQADITPRVLSLSGSKLVDGSTTAEASQLLAQNRVSGDDLALAGGVGLAAASSGAQAISDVSGLTLSGADAANYTLAGAGGTVAVNNIGTAGLVLEQLVSGSASASTSGSTITITQNSDKAILNWLKFSLGEGETLVFEQPSASAVVLNRVTGSDPSVIAGTLSANGRVFILNPNGVLFTSTSQVSVAALVASTLALGNDDFLDDARFLFVAGASEAGSVIAEGDIVIADGGFLALASGQGVRLAGSLTAVDGDALLVAATQLQLDTAPAGLADYAIAGLSATATLDGAPVLGGGLLETAGASLALNVQPGAGAWSLTLPALTLGSTFSAAFVQSQLALLDLRLNALAGDLVVADNLSWSSDHALGLAASGSIAIQGRIAASGSHAGLSLDGNYVIDSARLDYAGNAVGHDNAGITLSGADASLSIDGVAYTLLRGMDDVSAIDASAGAGYYALAHDIDAGGTSHGEAVVERLSGTLAGLGNSIVNLSIDAGLSDYVGLIGQADSGAVIRDLGLEQASVRGHSYVGTLLGAGSGVTLQNVWATGSVTGVADDTASVDGSYYLGGLAGSLESGSSVSRARASVAVAANVSALADITGNMPSGSTGGLVGRLRGASLTESYATGAVVGYSGVGGLVGTLQDGAAVTYSWASGEVNGGLITLPDGSTATTAGNVGGLVGSMTNGSSLDHVRATGNVTAGYVVGGLVGSSTASSISNAAASGTVTSRYVETGHFWHWKVGGLVGENIDGSITSSSASGDVLANDRNDPIYDASDVGGLVGRNSGSGTISNSFATGRVSGGNNTGGLVGTNFGSIVNSWASGAVAGTGAVVGGLVGNNPGQISASWASGAVAGRFDVGGLAGSNTGLIEDSYASGDVAATDPGRGGVDRLVGANGGTIRNSRAIDGNGPAEPPDPEEGAGSGLAESVGNAVEAAVAATRRSEEAPSALPGTQYDFSGNSNAALQLLSALMTGTGDSRGGAAGEPGRPLSASLRQIEVDGMTFQLSDDEDCEGAACAPAR